MKTYVIFLRSTRKKMTRDIILQHIEHLRDLDQRGHYVLGGPFINTGEGMLVIQAQHEDEAIQLAELDPFVRLGVREYTIKEIELANHSNRYLDQE